MFQETGPSADAEGRFFTDPDGEKDGGIQDIQAGKTPFHKIVETQKNLDRSRL